MSSHLPRFLRSLAALALALPLALSAVSCMVEVGDPSEIEDSDEAEPIGEVSEEARRCMPSSCPYNCEFTAGLSGNRYTNKSPLLKVPKSSSLRLIWRVRVGTELKDGFGKVRGTIQPWQSPPSFLHCSLEAGTCQANFDCGDKEGAAKKVCFARKAEAKLECCQYKKHFSTKPWVLLNEGITKKIDGVRHYYAFAVKIQTASYAGPTGIPLTEAGKILPVSGWIAASDVELVALHQKQQLENMPKVPNPPQAHALYKTPYVVMGGDPTDFNQPGCSVGGKPCTYKVVKGERRKILPQCGSGRYLAYVGSEGPKPQDYLLRPGGVVNLLYQLPGVGGASLDSFPVGSIFHRAKLPDGCGGDSISIPTYKAAKSQAEAIAWSKKARPGGYCGPPRVEGKDQVFYYGFIWDGARRRYGWIARDALRPVHEIDIPNCGCMAKCVESSKAVPILPDEPAFEPYCESTAKAYCKDHGGFESSAFVDCP